MTEIEMAKKALQRKSEELGEIKLVLESTEYKLLRVTEAFELYKLDNDAGYWKKQSDMFKAEVSRLKLYKLCEQCKCQNYHERGCSCYKEPPKPRGDGL